MRATTNGIPTGSGTRGAPPLPMARLEARRNERNPPPRVQRGQVPVTSEGHFALRVQGESKGRLSSRSLAAVKRL